MRVSKFSLFLQVICVSLILTNYKVKGFALTVLSVLINALLIRIKHECYLVIVDSQFNCKFKSVFRLENVGSSVLKVLISILDVVAKECCFTFCHQIHITVRLCYSSLNSNDKPWISNISFQWTVVKHTLPQFTVVNFNRPVMQIIVCLLYTSRCV